jgi:hypothetical protein
LSPTPIDLSPDLKRLRDEGYDVRLSQSQNHIAVHHIPYVNAAASVLYGTLVCPLNLEANITKAPVDHVMHFDGEYPCHENGQPISEISNASGDFALDGLEAKHLFSAKPAVPFPDFYEKVVAYVRILSAPATALKPDAKAKTFHVAVNTDETMPFVYADTATSRAGISEPTGKLVGLKVAIIGLGGTGSYILDLVSKTPVSEIHLYDPDVFSQHNAFRSPGAADIHVWDAEAPEVYKVDYLAEIYAHLHTGISPHRQAVDEGCVTDLAPMNFVFLCVDNGEARRLIIEYLISVGVPLIDVGMGLMLESGQILGSARTTTLSAARNDHVGRRVSFAAATEDDIYAHNIQVADMNALNAALAVIRWKKLMGFYADEEGEHHSNYLVYSNHISNDEFA